mmetsp:Transcript_3189/g.8836  ORF Transcript_3189/g.8836 Transcript_3189/m.8836 type:complete len:216 (+) Transcript_3189:208-855(+)
MLCGFLCLWREGLAVAEEVVFLGPSCVVVACSLASWNARSSVSSSAFRESSTFLFFASTDSRNSSSSASRGLFFPCFISFHCSWNSSFFCCFLSWRTCERGFEDSAPAPPPSLFLISSTWLSVTNFTLPRASFTAFVTAFASFSLAALSSVGNTDSASRPRMASLSNTCSSRSTRTIPTFRLSPSIARHTHTHTHTLSHIHTLVPELGFLIMCQT